MADATRNMFYLHIHREPHAQKQLSHVKYIDQPLTVPSHATTAEIPGHPNVRPLLTFASPAV